MGGLDWIEIADGLPDDEETVVVHVVMAAGSAHAKRVGAEEGWQGFGIGTFWTGSDEQWEVYGIAGEVTRWARISRPALAVRGEPWV